MKDGVNDLNLKKTSWLVIRVSNVFHIHFLPCQYILLGIFPFLGMQLPITFIAEELSLTVDSVRYAVKKYVFKYSHADITDEELDIIVTTYHDESVYHFLFHCPIFFLQRTFFRVACATASVAWPPELAAIPKNPVVWQAMRAFIHSTGRLSSRGKKRVAALTS